MEVPEQAWIYLINAFKSILVNNSKSINHLLPIKNKLEKIIIIIKKKEKKLPENNTSDEKSNDDNSQNEKSLIKEKAENKKMYINESRQEYKEKLLLIGIINSALFNAYRVFVADTQQVCDEYKRILVKTFYNEPKKYYRSLVTNISYKELISEYYQMVVSIPYYDILKNNTTMIINNIKKFPDYFPLVVYPAVHIPKLILNEKKTPILYIYPPPKRTQGRDGASMDLESLKIQTILLFSKYNFTIKYCHESGMSPSGKLPFLINSDGEILAGRKLLEEITKFNSETKQLLSEEDESMEKAFSSLVDEKLTRAWLYNKWCDETNFKTITMETYHSLYPKPLSYILAYIDRNKIIKTMLSRKNVLKDDDIYLQAKMTLEAISEQIGDNEFFFGLRPTYLDATLFAHLHIILSTPSQQCELRRLVLQHENLVQYSKRIWKQYFAIPFVHAASPINENLLTL